MRTKVKRRPGGQPGTARIRRDRDASNSRKGGSAQAPAPVPDTAPLTHQELKALSSKLRRPVSTLIALADKNDPFIAGRAGRRLAAEWFAAQWRREGWTPFTRLHKRRVHYRWITREAPLLLPNGKPYLNTDRCWKFLKDAARDALYLDLIPENAFIDAKNDEALVAEADPVRQGASILVDRVSSEAYGLLLDAELANLPSLSLLRPSFGRQYQIEVWCEKSTINDVLAPLFRTYGINIVIGEGDLSLTRCKDLVQRAAGHRRPTRIFYIADFDPGGDNMPVAVARKIEFEMRKAKLELDITLDPVALTVEQCQQLRLPRTPIKEKETRRARFEERFGEGATELDALEALHPGLLGRMLTDRIKRYRDATLSHRIRAVAQPLEQQLAEITDRVHARFAPQVEAAKQHWAEVVERVNTLQGEVRAAQNRADNIYREIAAALLADAPDPNGISWPAPRPADESPDPLFDSKRNYIEQIDRYKRHQDKPTRRRKGGEP